MPLGGGYTTLEAKTNLVRAITDKSGRLRAIGKLVHLGSRIAILRKAGSRTAPASSTRTQPRPASC
jgi:acyl-coenzyme A thioesterase PaaI-like protein